MDQPPPACSLTSPWKVQRGLNPYKHNAFLVLGVETDVTHAAALNYKKDRRVRKMRSGSRESNTLHGRPLSEADVIHAYDLLEDPTRRRVEEMLQHQAHVIPAGKFREVSDSLEDVRTVPDAPLEWLGPVRLEALADWLPHPTPPPPPEDSLCPPRPAGAGPEPIREETVFL